MPDLTAIKIAFQLKAEPREQCMQTCCFATVTLALTLVYTTLTQICRRYTRRPKMNFDVKDCEIYSQNT